MLDTSGQVAPAPGDAARRECFIPTACVQNHAAFLMPLSDGTLGCAWFGGTQEGVPDISVRFSRLEGDAWSAPATLSEDATRSEQNPLLFNAPGGALWLLWTAQMDGNQDTAIIRRRISRDDGRSWGAIDTLLPQPGTFIRNPIMIRPNGDWLLPIWHCARPAVGAWTGDLDTSSVLRSADAGATWDEHPVPGSTGQVHMCLLPAGEGMVALYRSRWADAVHRSVSADGLAWSAPEPVGLPNNNSSIQAIRLRDGRLRDGRLRDGRLAMVFNDSSARDATARRTGLYDDLGGEAEAPSAAFWGAPRAPMTLALSDDDGLTWPWRRNLETGDGYCMTNNSKDGLNREFSYPSIVQTGDGMLHIAYTYWRQAIKYVRVSPEWVLA